MKENLQEDTNTNPQQSQETPQKLKPQHLMDRILLDARAYTIKYKAARKREENDEKQKTQDKLNNTVRHIQMN